MRLKKWPPEAPPGDSLEIQLTQQTSLKPSYFEKYGKLTAHGIRLITTVEHPKSKVLLPSGFHCLIISSIKMLVKF